MHNRKLFKTSKLTIPKKRCRIIVLREQDKHFLASLYAAVAVIFAWKGIWEGIYIIPYLSDYIGNPFVFLFIGLTMLTFSGLIFKEFDPFGDLEKSTTKILNDVHNHPEKKQFIIKYYDKVKQKNITLNPASIIKVERGAIIVKAAGKNQEIFIPNHRVTEVLYKGKPYWRL